MRPGSTTKLCACGNRPRPNHSDGRRCHRERQRRYRKKDKQERRLLDIWRNFSPALAMLQKPCPTRCPRALRLALISFLAIASSEGAFATEGQRPMEFDDLMRAQRLSDPQISPDGRSVAYV